MQEEWYVELDGAADGPHQRHAVLQMRGAGRLDTGTLVWREGLPDWVRYADAGLEHTPLPPALPVADRWPQVIAPTASDHQALVPQISPSWVDLAEDPPLRTPRLEVEDDGWQWTTPSPWRRYFARSLDTLLLGWFAWMMFSVIAAAVNKTLFEAVFTRSGMMGVPLLRAMAMMAALIPVQAMLIGLSGTTIGKWIFGVRITRRDGRAIGLRAALARELSVYGLGLGGGVPVLAFIPILIAYQVLTRTGSTPWDRDKDWVVTQRAPGEGQEAMFIIGLMVLFTAAAVLRYVGLHK